MNEASRERVTRLMNFILKAKSNMTVVTWSETIGRCFGKLRFAAETQSAEKKKSSRVVLLVSRPQSLLYAAFGSEKKRA